MNISKSKYVSFCNCSKRFWLDVHHPELAKKSTSFAKRGTEFGDYVRDLFGEYFDVTTLNSDGSLDYGAMIDYTQSMQISGADNICEAAFSYNGCYCAVDILHKTKNGYEIYEVKSSSGIKDKYLIDVAYQKYVLTNYGLNITGVYIVYVNNKYVLNGEIDKRQLCIIEEVSDRIGKYYAEIEENIAKAKACAELTDEPKVNLYQKCKDCPYWQYCQRDIPKPSVLDLYSCEKKWEYYNNGIITFDDFVESKITATPMQSMQVKTYYSKGNKYVEKYGIKEFVDTLSYPLYFLDFETMSPAIPEIQGTHPYQAIPFQYSLHYVENEGGEVKHKEYLADSFGDPRRKLAERLLEDIENPGAVMAYNMSTERRVINNLAELYPDLADKLKKVSSKLCDPLTVFHKGYYYTTGMGGSFSVKSVLPALFPDDPELNYHNLDGVQNGTEAMDIFPQIKYMSEEEAEKARAELLKYCKLDTLAMVKIWQTFVKDSK